MGAIYKIYYSTDQSLGQEDFDILYAMDQIKAAAISNGIAPQEANKTEESALKYASTANWAPKPKNGRVRKSTGWSPPPPRPVPTISITPPKPVSAYILNDQSIVYYDYPRFNERKAGKKGGWQHLNNEGVWYTGRGSTEPVFYNEPKDWGQWEGCDVVVLEGEKDVETMKSLQDPNARKVLFLSGSFGANSPKMPYELLPKDVNVYFFYDADKAGREGARVAAQQCASTRKDLDVYHHAMEGDKGIDATDAYEQGGREGAVNWFFSHMDKAKARGRMEMSQKGYTQSIERPPRPTGDRDSRYAPRRTPRERYQEVVKDDIVTMVQAIKEGEASWQKTWDPDERVLAHNLDTGNDYMGLNQLRLMQVAEARGYTEARWATFDQIKEAGGYVKKGEKGTSVTGWYELGMEERIIEEQHLAQLAKEQGVVPDEIKKNWRVKIYPVFNLSQAEGIEPVIENPTWDPIEKAEQIVKNSGVEVREGGEVAAYDPVGDYIEIPKIEIYKSPEDYYIALLHELTHATGHASRMDRFTFAERESHNGEMRWGAREELRVETSAMLTCTMIGLGYKPAHEGMYVDGWMEILNDAYPEIMAVGDGAHKISAYLLEGMGKGIDLDIEWGTPKATYKEGSGVQSHPPGEKPKTKYSFER